MSAGVTLNPPPRRHQGWAGDLLTADAMSHRSMLPPGWPIFLMLNGIFLWWVLGLHLFIGPLIALPCLFHLMMRGDVRAPRSFVLWILFLLWAALSATQISTIDQWGSFAFRQTSYLAGIVIYLYLVNIPRSQLPSKRLVTWLTVFWALIVVGGTIGTLFPNVSFTTPVEAILPKRVLSTTYIYFNVHAATSGEKVFTSIPVYRTKAPFGYQNQWGQVYAILLAFPLASLALTRSRAWRRTLVLLLGVSILPLVVSLDRGAWLSTGMAIVISAGWLAIRNRPGQLAAVLIGSVLTIALLVATPLGGFVLTRIDSGYGDKHRLRLYSQAVDLTQQNPIIGYGAPVDVETGPKAIAAGTHGQFWTILVSHGVPGVIFFFGWFVVVLLRGLRKDSYLPRETEEIRFWANVSLVTALSQIAYYEWLPYGHFVVIVTAAIASREAPPRRPRRWVHLNGSPADVPATPSHLRHRPPDGDPHLVSRATSAPWSGDA
jgi:O-antigen ligase